MNLIQHIAPQSYFPEETNGCKSVEEEIRSIIFTHLFYEGDYTIGENLKDNNASVCTRGRILLLELPLIGSSRFAHKSDFAIKSVRGNRISRLPSALIISKPDETSRSCRIINIYY
ncbi:hypothetical protein TNCV_2623111 [Trichonephila clavipes]|nr:hypothetical protein TNCV_2623111 [Trichonephila clavipes]